MSLLKKIETDASQTDKALLQALDFTKSVDHMLTELQKNGTINLEVKEPTLHEDQDLREAQ